MKLQINPNYVGDPMAGEARVGDETITFPPFPDGLWAMIEAGGLVPYLQVKGDF